MVARRAELAMGRWHCLVNQGDQSRDAADRWGRLDRVMSARHVAVFAAALLVFFLRHRMAVEVGVLWILGAAALANFVGLLAATSTIARARTLARVVSPVIGVASWTSLVAWTGGAGSSPLVAALALEIVLAARIEGPIGIAAVTAAAVSGLWLQEFLRGPGEAIVPLVIQSGLLLGVGFVAVRIRWRWKSEERDLSVRLHAAAQHLKDLERDLTSARRLAQVGTEAAELAHALKNAVHGLRGLIRMARLRRGQAADEEVFRALEQSIEDLDRLGRRALVPTRSACRREGSLTGERLRLPLEEAVQRLSQTYPGVSCAFRFQSPESDLLFSGEVVREVATNLLLNAAEAMNGRGVVELHAGNGPDGWRVTVRDHGSGLSPEAQPLLFEPGFTTKPDGNGMGLFLCRRMVESQGGRLSLRPGNGQGASFEAVFPGAPETFAHG